MQVKREYEKLQHYKNEYKVINVYGGKNIHEQISLLSFGVDIVIGTPGRTIDLIKRGKLKFSNL